MKLTKARIDALKYEGAKLTHGHSRDIRWDDETSGLGVRIYPSGKKHFVLSYRIKGRKRLYTIGKYGDPFTLEMARKKAGKLKGAIIDGEDPLRCRQEERSAPTVKELAKKYLSDHAERHKRPASVRDDRAMIDKIILPRLGSRKVADITFADVDTLHARLKATPYRANRVVALLSKMFSLASTRWRDWSRLDHNPAKGIERYPEEGRERYLSPPELGALTKALTNHPNQSIANAIRLLILTGARKMEVLAAKWDQFDLDEGVWVKPSAHTKQKREHRVPLNAPALQLLTGMKADAEREETDDGEFVFQGGQGNSHLTEIKKVWKTVCKEAAITGCRVHDLRHTYASILASSGLSLLVIGQLLGHTQQATTKRYAHLQDDPLREATNRVGSLVDAAAKGKTAEVVEIAGRKG